MKQVLNRQSKLHLLFNLNIVNLADLVITNYKLESLYEAIIGKVKS